MKKTVITKIALFIGYVLFAGYSAYFTATSLSVALFQGTYMWLIYVMVFIVALLAGWCLNNVIVQTSSPTTKTEFLLNVIGLILFWGVSFTTNVHYFFIDKHGYDVVSKELAACKDYITANTTSVNKQIDDDCFKRKMVLQAQVNSASDSFTREINNTLANHTGFGDACISILKSLERIFEEDKSIYGDSNDYVLYDSVRDRGDYGQTQRSQISSLSTKYNGRIMNALNRKYNVIDAFYDRRKESGQKLKTVMKSIENLENNHLPIVKQDGSVTALFAYRAEQNDKVIRFMPDDFMEKSCMQEGKSSDYKVYPSSRMFDTFTVWSDIFHGRLPGYMNMLQWILISLVIDIIAFLLFRLFCK